MRVLASRYKARRSSLKSGRAIDAKTNRATPLSTQRSGTQPRRSLKHANHRFVISKRVLRRSAVRVRVVDSVCSRCPKYTMSVPNWRLEGLILSPNEISRASNSPSRPAGGAEMKSSR